LKQRHCAAAAAADAWHLAAADLAGIKQGSRLHAARCFASSVPSLGHHHHAVVDDDYKK